MKTFALRRLITFGFLFSFLSQGLWGAELHPWTLQAWERYVRLTEARIAGELNGGAKFLVTDLQSDGESRPVRSLIRNGQVYIRKLETNDEQGRKIAVKDGMIHHWIGVILVPGTKLVTLVGWLQDYDRHENYFKEVEKSKLVSRQGAQFNIFLRLRRKKIITVYYNTYHTAVYRQHDTKRVSSHSFTTKIAELDDPGATTERGKPSGDDSGFLWRLNSYWRFQEEGGGVVVECESISISRSIPAGLALRRRGLGGLGWLIHGYVESVPRESLEDTLRSIREGVGK